MYMLLCSVTAQCLVYAPISTHKAIRTDDVRACMLYNCRCMPENSLVNSDGFNGDPRTYMLHDTVTTLGQQSDECSVFMVVGMPLKAVAKASVASFACQVRSPILMPPKSQTHAVQACTA
jgi:hypothetical protein